MSLFERSYLYVTGHTACINLISKVKSNTHRRRRRDSAVESSRVGGVNDPSPVVTQFTISCAVELLRLVTSDDMSDIIVEKVTSKLIDQNSHIVKHRYGVCLANFQIVDRIRRQSTWTSCKFCSHRRRRHDSTRQLSRVGVGGVYWAWRIEGWYSRWQGIVSLGVDLQEKAR